MLKILATRTAGATDPSLLASTFPGFSKIVTSTFVTLSWLRSEKEEEFRKKHINRSGQPRTESGTSEEHSSANLEESTNNQPHSSSGEDIPDFSQSDQEQFDRAAKEAFDEWHKILMGEEETVPIVNLAGEGRAGWKVLWNDEETNEYWYALDLTGGKVPDNEKNALLCSGSKVLMNTMYSRGMSIAEIAEFFRVRQQRVMAILALQKIEETAEARGETLYHGFQEEVEGGWACRGDGSDGFPGIYECDEVYGTGERHVKRLPRAPQYETKVGKDGKLEHRNYEELEEKLAAEEEAMLVQEFEAKLLYNMKEAGKSLMRNITKEHRPKRPKRGFSLVVKPKGKGKVPYVAKPDGQKRGLNKDEHFLQRRQAVRPRRRML